MVYSRFSLRFEATNITTHNNYILSERGMKRKKRGNWYLRRKYV
uniref:Uncharacterized protein n=1 Tax=Staphylococcus phage 184DA TaxID=3110532 RepID=A0AAU6MXF6_9CAUD